jgi:hypothetical protein
MSDQNPYFIANCEDTQKPALYRRFVAAQPGAMSGNELIAHVEDFEQTFAVLAEFLSINSKNADRD